MTTKESIEQYLASVVKDMAAQNEKVPVSAFRIEATDSEGKLFAPDWFKYMILGRGPGKQPPPDKIIAWLERNPDILSSAQSVFKYLTNKSLAYLIGRKIGREGTDIFQGKKKGVDLLGAMEDNMETLKTNIARSEILKFKTSLQSALR